MQEAKADIIYGATSSGKTGAIGELAELVFERTGKITRLITADGGGYKTIKPQVDGGLIEVWSIQNWPYPIEALDKACQGQWPVDFDDPKKGLESLSSIGIGLTAFEGLTSFGDLIMRQLRNTKARLSQDPSYMLKDGGTEFSGGSPSYYGFVQDRLYDLVGKTHMLPSANVLWTALEARGEEDGTKVPIYGPAIAGKKSIGKAPAWFRRCFHVELAAVEQAPDANKQVKIATKRMLYLKPHAEPATKVIFPANSRVPMEFDSKVPDYLEPASLRKAYELLDTLEAQGTNRIKALLASRTAPAATAVRQ